ncbi:MAG: PhoH family protein [Pigmentiphaga sp.]|nr:PhoH family protein [Pigmentiphaga sp.]
MPLPKMPTRPATILPAPAKAPALRPRGRKTPASAAQPPEHARAEPETPIARSADPVAVAVVNKAASSAPARPSTPTAPAPTAKPGRQAKSPPPADAPSTRIEAEAGAAPVERRRTGHRPVATDDQRRRLFVLDTNVLLHDPASLFRFEEHDVFIPMTTLEELDHNKKGMSEVARNARQVSRTLDELITGESLAQDGVALSALGNREARGRLLLQTETMAGDLPAELPVGKGDNQILGVVRTLQQRHPERHVVLVSKDINMRLKARALGLAAEDYFNDQVIEDTDLLYSGILQLPDDFWQRVDKNLESWQQGGSTFYRLRGALCTQFMVNQFVHLEGAMPLQAQVREVQGDMAVLQTLRDYTHKKNNVWGITARNREQNFALNLLMNPDCDFVSLLGQAGTGKTLLTLAAGLTQVLETKRYSEIIITRVTVPVGEDIGFLPGTEEEKMQPWMGALDDNLEVLNQGSDGHAAGGDWGRSATFDLIRNKIRIKSLNFMRGRTFLNKLIILDEAQNLTPKQMKTLITRAGPGTKVVCLGNIAQIDTPYLTEGSSGLTYVVDRFKGWPHSGHITLQRGERSRLADFAAEAL